MIFQFSILQIVILGVTAFICLRVENNRIARTYATAAILAVSLAALGILLVGFVFSEANLKIFLGEGVFTHQVGMVLLFTSLISYVAIALSPLQTTGRETFSRILILTAIALATFSVEHIGGIAFLWILSWYVVRSEIISSTGKSGLLRVFDFYHIPSVLLVVFGVIAILNQQPALGVLLILFGTLIKQAVLPFHSWFPIFFKHVNRGVAVVFISSQLGIFIHYQLLAGHLSVQSSQLIAILGGLTALIAAALSSIQFDPHRALAYLIMSSGGLVVFGMGGESQVAQIGALLMWQVVGMSTASLAMILTSLESRRGPLNMLIPSGNLSRTPKMAVAFLVLGFACIGLPATLGFVGTDMLLNGSIETFPIFGLVVIISTALNAITVMRMFFGLFCGSNKNSGEKDFAWREWCAVSSVVLLIVISGVWPQVFIDKVSYTVRFAKENHFLDNNGPLDIGKY